MIKSHLSQMKPRVLISSPLDERRRWESIVDIIFARFGEELVLHRTTVAILSLCVHVEVQTEHPFDPLPVAMLDAFFKRTCTLRGGWTCRRVATLAHVSCKVFAVVALVERF